MSGTVVRRCEGCHQPVLLADHGEVLPIGGARIIGVSKHGDSTVQCSCGQTMIWTRRTQDSQTTANLIR